VLHIIVCLEVKGFDDSKTGTTSGNNGAFFERVVISASKRVAVNNEKFRRRPKFAFFWLLNYTHAANIFKGKLNEIFLENSKKQAMLTLATKSF
jgi:hypothetical protein